MSAELKLAAKPSLTLQRRIKAPPSKVYAAWTDPALVTRWWGPGPTSVLRAELDPRIGGRFHIVFRTADGGEHDVGGVYREVLPDKKLSFTWAWHSTPERESLVTVDIEAEGKGTLLTLTHAQFFDEGARDRHSNGWNGALDKLEQLFT